MSHENMNNQPLNDEELKNSPEETKPQAENTSDLQDATSKQEEEHEEKKLFKKKKNPKNTELEQKIKELEEARYKMSEINDKYMRLSAEFDNYRKRTLKEKSDLFKTAGAESLKDLLPVVDDFERALLSMETATEINAVKEGILLIYTKFKEIMKVKGMVEIEALHQEFNTDMHEALTKIPAPTEELKGKVVDVIQKGYKIEDKVIRYAKVVIGE